LNKLKATIIAIVAFFVSKPMTTLKYLFLFISFFFSFSLFGQNKVEQEIHIKEAKVPVEARKWLKDAFEIVKKPKWYQELSEAGYSFEAKFKYKNQFHSVEFDSMGLVQDVEVLIDWNDLPIEIRSNLMFYFEESLSGFKLEKIQIQYSGSPLDLEDFFDENELDGVLVQYEIEYQAQDQSQVTRLWEGIFSSEGRFLSQRRIEIREAFNLSY